MSQEKFTNEIEIRRFLLGESSEKERAATEEKFLADEDFFVQIRAVEDELIENYVRGILTNGEKENFEREFLQTETRRERVRFTREMLEKIKEYGETAKKTETVSTKTPFRNLIAALFKSPQLAFGAALTILILVFGFWFLILRKPSNQIEIVKEITPTPTIQANVNQSLPSNQNINANSNNSAPPDSNQTEKRDSNKPNVNTETPKKEEVKPKTIVPNPVLALFAGTVRSEGKTNELNLPKEAAGANLQLNLEGQDYQTYRAEIVDADGKIIYRSGKLVARKAKVYAFVPAKNLKRGDYMLKLYGFSSSGAEETAADFQFRVNQK